MLIVSKGVSSSGRDGRNEEARSDVDQARLQFDSVRHELSLQTNICVVNKLVNIERILLQRLCVGSVTCTQKVLGFSIA